jgi:hypothetical protein
LSIAKSGDAENAGATQHSPKQRPQDPPLAAQGKG